MLWNTYAEAKQEFKCELRIPGVRVINSRGKFMEGQPKPLDSISLNHILFATDFSVSSMQALPYAIDVARRFNSRLCIAHVLSPDEYPSGFNSEDEAAHAACREAEPKMSAILQSAPCRAISCESEITTGDIWTGLTDLMRRHATELLVMGTVGRRGFRKILLGSVAEEAMRESSCPVLTVGPHIQSTDNISFRHVLYASDFSDDSLAGVRYAFDISEKYAARLTLVHALEGFPESPYLEAQMATVQLRKLISTRPRLPVVPDIVVEMGSAASVILEAAKKVGADLIVIGVRGAGSLPRLATHFGSVAHKIVCGAGCPVLTVRRLQEPRQ